MQLLESKSDELLKLIVEDYENIGIHSGVPFVIYTYPPELETEAIKEVERLGKKLEKNNQKSILIRFDELFRRFTEESIGDLEELYKLEEDNRDSLKRAIAKEIGDNIIKYIIEESKKSPDKVVFLYRTGAIHPILKVHLLMDAFENKIKAPLVLLYPGSSDKKKLRFLNKDIPEEGYYYRARILWGR